MRSLALNAVDRRGEQRMQRAERGFSLIELMVALTITLVVSGAIYGLMASGQGAFRREPALVDRQQNIRIAMDLIARDVENAGTGMHPASQVFTNSLDNPSTGSVASEILAGQKADFLEILSNDGSCPALSVGCAPGVVIRVDANLPACVTTRLPGFFYVSGPSGPASSNGTPGLLWLELPGGGGGGGGGSCASPGVLNTPPGQGWVNPPGGGCPGGGPSSGGGNCASISIIGLVRYELAPENPAVAVNPITNPPCLWRSESGRRNRDGSANTGPYTGNDPGGNPSPWQLIARGIDDMQIEYQTGVQWPSGAPTTWLNTPGNVDTTIAIPPAAVAGNFDSIVRRVRITLSSRALGNDLGGETTYNPSGTRGRRGQLTTIVSPRAALNAVWVATANNWR